MGKRHTVTEPAEVSPVSPGLALAQIPRKLGLQELDRQFCMSAHWRYTASRGLLEVTDGLPEP